MIVFDDIITDMLSNKKIEHIVTELFVCGTLHNSLVFMIKLDFVVPKGVTLTLTLTNCFRPLIWHSTMMIL